MSFSKTQARDHVSLPLHCVAVETRESAGPPDWQPPRMKDEVSPSHVTPSFYDEKTGAPCGRRAAWLCAWPRCRPPGPYHSTPPPPIPYGRVQDAEHRPLIGTELRLGSCRRWLALSVRYGLDEAGDHWATPRVLVAAAGRCFWRRVRRRQQDHQRALGSTLGTL